MTSKKLLIILSFFCLQLVLSEYIEAQEAKSFVYDVKGRRDPFWPLVDSVGVVNNYDSEVALTDLNLEGIITGANGNIAMINGQIININAKLGEFVVAKINADSVELKKGDQTFLLKIKKEE